MFATDYLRGLIGAAMGLALLAGPAPVQAAPFEVCTSAEVLEAAERRRLPQTIGQEISAGARRIGLRYNPYIITTHNDALQSAQKTRFGRNVLPPDLLALGVQRSEELEHPDAVRAARHLAATRGTFIYHAPIFLDAFHQCPGGALSPLDGYRALQFQRASPRVRGDLCAALPQIAFIEAPFGQMLRSTSHTYEGVFRSRLMTDDLIPWGALQPQIYQRGEMIDHYRDEVSKILALRAVQCGGLPDRMQIAFLRQRTLVSHADAAAIHHDDYFEPVLETTLTFGPDGVRHAITVTTEDAQRVAAGVQRQQVAAIRAADSERQAYERFTVGVVIVFGAMAFVASQQDPCDTNRIDRPWYC